MKSRLFISLVFVLNLLSLYGYNKTDNKEFPIYGNWDTDLKRSLSSKIPISGKVTNGLLILTNSRPDRAVSIKVCNRQGQTVVEKEVSKENSSCIIVPLSELRDGEAYTLVLTSSIQSDHLVAHF